MAQTFASLTTAVALFASSSFAAFAGGTDAQREACTPDAFKLCASSMPDEGRVESCLRGAGPRLSPACYAVFYPQSANNQTQTTRGQSPSRAEPSAPDRMQTPSMPQMPPRTVGDGDE